MVQARGYCICSCLEGRQSWGVPRCPASAKDHGTVLTQPHKLAAMRVDGVVNVKQLRRDAVTHVCHPGVRKVAHPGIEVPGQQGMALKGCRHQVLCQSLETQLSRPVTLLCRKAGLGRNVADTYGSGLLAGV